MLLDKYLALNGLTQRAFSERVGCTKQRINQLVAGRGVPSAGLICRIRDATEGAVTLDDLVPSYRKAKADE